MASAADSAAAPAAAPAPHPSGLSVDERFQLLRSVGEECISEAELRNLIEKKPEIRCYDGFEPSGRMHIAQGIFKAINVNKCTKAGCTFTFWVADWFALMNDKMDGELRKIRIVGEYLVEVWQAAGMDMRNVDFRWSSDDINNHAKDYWRRVIDIGRKNTIKRMEKCCQIMGRKENSLSAAQILYPMMQCADIFHLKADICQLGLDQRKVNMLAREYCDAIGRKLKPVILSHHMLSGLVEGMGKMSKSNPDSAIFMEDSAADVRRKIEAAYCPRVMQGESKYTEDGELVASKELNPCLDYVKCTSFAVENGSFTAGGQTFKSYEEVEAAFVEGSLSEEALKNGLIDVINALLEPVRQHFATNERAKSLLEQVKTFRGAAPAPAAAAAEAEAPAPSAPTPRLVAWLPLDLKVPMAQTLGVVAALNAFVERGDGRKATLVVPDWSAYATTRCGGDEKDIAAAAEVQRAITQSLDLRPEVDIVLQGDMILRDPNAYWLDVIAAGRRFKLDEIAMALGEVPDAGHVVAALMRMADVRALDATEVVAANAADVALSQLAARFTDGRCQAAQSAAPLPFRETLCDPKAAPTTADDWLYNDESELDFNRKMKRAFAAPQDDSSTVAQMGGFFIASRGGFTVSRSEANGGNKEYKSADELLADCRSGALHPGDLKAAVGSEMKRLMEKLRGVLNSADVKKALTVIKNAEKKASKKK